MFNKTVLLITIIILCVGPGCSLYRIDSEETAGAFIPSKNPSDIIYAETLSQPHEIIGKLSVRTQRRQPFDEIIEKMKREAAIIGGDAITDIKNEEKSGGRGISTTYTASVVAFK